MMNEQILFHLTEKCDIYFDDLLISREKIIRKYVDFCTSMLSSDGHCVSIALHTGSVCFEIVSFVTAVLACVLLDKTDAESIIASLDEGDMVLYKNKRYYWCGMEISDGKQFLKLKQDGRGKSGPVVSWIPFETGKGLIKPYYGTSDVTDGRGIRRKNNNRADFISHILGVDIIDVPSITGVSTVIVTERDTFDRLSRGLRIVYGGGKSIDLLDIVTASYYTDSGEEYQYGNNPAKIEPTLKITGKISTARDLVLDRYGNTVVGLMVIGSDSVLKGGFELIDLLGRRTFKFAHVAAEIGCGCAEEIIEMQEDAAVFACTKEFLLQNSFPPQEINDLTLELDRQVRDIVNNIVITETVDGGCAWENLCKAKEALYAIRKSGWNDSAKNTFLVTAYSLFNLFVTAIFPIKTLEKAIERGKLMARISSPGSRIRQLWDLADEAESMDYHCAYVADVLESLYKSCFYNCSKYDALKQHFKFSDGKEIAVVVPKAFYIDILREDEMFRNENITIITANRFENTVRYDRIIAVGDFSGKRFEPLRCKAAADIIVLLYECEMHRFMYKKQKLEIFEKELNFKIGVASDDIFMAGDDIEVRDIDERFVKAETDLEQYINSISIFDIGKYIVGGGVAENTPTSEVYATGRFVSGEQILFSKYYNAVVFNPKNETVSEVGVEDFSAGTQLVFAKRDHYTRNMVDYIYENLQTAGHLSADVLDATEKAAYWKEALREYKAAYNFSYRDIAEGLQKLGSSLQEVSVRQWLIEESHIVGPRDEITLKQIAELTQDPYLFGDTHGYFEACRFVRRQRKEILGFIGKAIAGKLSGHRPPAGSILEIVYDNVENLSEILELDAITLLQDPITVSVNLINKPIID